MKPLSSAVQVLVAFAMVCATPTVVSAKPKAPEPAAAAAPQVREIRVSLDAATPISLASPAGGVVVGNPSIAAVTVQTNRLLFVTGKSYGSTNLIVVDDEGRPLFQGRVTVVADEAGAVMLTRGSQTVRFDCTPECRRRPDLSDSPEAFSAISGLIQAREGASKE